MVLERFSPMLLFWIYLFNTCWYLTCCVCVFLVCFLVVCFVDGLHFCFDRSIYMIIYVHASSISLVIGYVDLQVFCVIPIVFLFATLVSQMLATECNQSKTIKDMPVDFFVFLCCKHPQELPSEFGWYGLVSGLVSTFFQKWKHFPYIGL